MCIIYVGNSIFFGCISLRSAFIVDGSQLSDLFFGVHGKLVEDPFLLGIETSDGGIGQDVDLLIKSLVFSSSIVDLFLFFFFFSGISVTIGRSINISVFEVIVVVLELS